MATTEQPDRGNAPSRRRLLASAAVLGAATWAAPSIVSMDAVAAASCSTCAGDPATNFVPNPNADTVAFGTDPDYDPVAMIGAPPPGVPLLWSTTNGFRVLSYATASANGQYPTSPPSGTNPHLFTGPIGAALSPATASTARAPLGCVDEISLGDVPFTLSGSFAAIDSDTIELRAAFYTAGDVLISTATVGPITTSTVAWEHASTTGSVPADAASVQFTLVATKGAGNTSDYNHGAAAELAFVLCG